MGHLKVDVMPYPVKRVKIEHDGSSHDAPILLDATSLADGVRRVAQNIAEWSLGLSAGRLQIISVLDGATPFTKDIIRELDGLGVRSDIHAVKVSNTTGTRASVAPVLERGKIPADEIRGTPTIILDDIVDTGGTLGFIKKIALDARPAEVRVAAVVNKYARLSNVSDFTIFDCALEEDKMVSRDGKKVDYWFFGYGMDLDGKYREFGEIGWLEIER